MLAAKGIDLISLVAPTSSDERLARICSNARGFIYAVSRAGVTGARSDVSSDARTLVERVRSHTGLPVAVGFGISTARRIKECLGICGRRRRGVCDRCGDIEKADPTAAARRSRGVASGGFCPKLQKRGDEN